MCISIFFAQVIGLWLFFIALAMIMHETRFKKAVNETLTNPVLMNFMGFATLGLGILVVISHNLWVMAWPVVVTLVGWALVLQGVMRLFFPEKFSKLMKDLTAKSGFQVMIWLWLIVGAFLIWTGFIR